MSDAGAHLDRHPVCHLTTTGRVSGRAHRIELWFAARGATVYLLSGGREHADWVRNLAADPAATVEIDGVAYPGRARVIAAVSEDDLARHALHAKYAPAHGELPRWRDTALPVAIDLDLASAETS